MIWPLPLLMLILLLGGCSWLTSGEYFTCEVEWECDDCKDVTLRVFGEQAANEESKEVENPGF